jgi:hypothetical protein
MITTALQLVRSTKGRLTRILFSAAALVLLVAGAARAAGPAVIISVKGFDELLADVTYLGDVLNQPQFAALPQVMINQLTQGQGLKGLDGAKPFGVYVTLSPQGQPQDIVVFVPVKDQKEFAATLEKLAPNPEKMGELTQYQFAANPNPILAKAGAKHFFFAPTAESLKETADPAKLVTVPADISIEIDLTQIPDGLKELYLTQGEAQAMSQLREVDDPAQRAIQEGTTKLCLAGLRRMVLDGSRVTFSLDINSKTKAIMLDLASTAKSGTTLAKASAGYAKTENPFSGLISKQTVGSYVVSVPLSSDTEGLLKLIVDESEKRGLANLPAEQAAKDTKTKVLKRIADMARSTIQRGRWDHSIVVSSADGKLQIVSAIKVAKGDQLGQAIEEFVKNTPEAKDKVKLNVAQVGKAKVHAITLPADEDREKYFGSGPAHLAISEDSVVFVLGGDSLAGVKGALNRSAGTPSRAPMALRIGLSKILALVNGLNPSAIPPAVFEQSKSALEGGLDQVGLEISGQPQALKFRLEVQEGVLRLAAVAATQN